MKKINFRSIIIGFLVITSFASYVFLSSVQIENVENAAVDMNNLDSTPSDTKIYMPDVELVKKAVAIGKAVMHPFSD